MTVICQKPASARSQIGYVTRDLDRAIDVLARTFDGTLVERRVGARLEIADDETAVVNVGRVTADGFTFKIIEPVSGAVRIWREGLPPSGDLLSHHHLSFTADCRSEFEELLRRHRDDGRRIALSGRNPGLAEFVYIDLTQTFGHYLELAVPI